MVSSTILSMRFMFCEESLYFDEEIFDDMTDTPKGAEQTLPSSNNLRTFWLLKGGKYRLYGVPDSVLAGWTELLTPRTSSLV